MAMSIIAANMCVLGGTVASVAVVVEGVVPDVYQGRKPQEVIQRQLAVAEALAARKEALMDEALP